MEEKKRPLVVNLSATVPVVSGAGEEGCMTHPVLSCMQFTSAKYVVNRYDLLLPKIGSGFVFLRV